MTQLPSAINGIVAFRTQAILTAHSRDEKLVHIIDTSSGKPAGNPISHVVEVAEVALDQTGPMISRHLALIDKDRNLWLTPARRSTPKFEKLGTMAHSIAFHDTTNMLSAMLDSKFIVWFHPSAVYVDKGIFTRARFIRPAELVDKLVTTVTYGNNLLQGFWKNTSHRVIP